jgi:hypothetical protein
MEKTGLMARMGLMVKTEKTARWDQREKTVALDQREKTVALDQREKTVALDQREKMGLMARMGLMVKTEKTDKMEPLLIVVYAKMP